MDKCVFDKMNPNIDLEDTLVDLCESIYDVDEEREKKAMFIDGLKELGEGYDSTSLSDLAEYVKDYVGGNYPDLSGIIPVNTDIYLAGKASNIDEEVQEEDSKTLALESPDFEDTPRRDFISKAYGTANEVQMAMEKDLRKNVVNSFLVNRDKGIVIGDTATLNSEVRSYQESLLSNVVTFLQNKYSNIESGRYNVEGALTELSGLVMYKGGIYTDALSKINRLAQPFLSPSKLTADALNSYYTDALSGHKPSKQFISAYNSLVILNNFDPLLEVTLGKVLEIKPGTKGDFVVDSNKYSLNGANNLPTNWRTNEDIFPEREISNIDRLLIETTPMYLWQSSTPLTNGTMGLQEFNYMVSKMKDLVNNPTTRTIKFDGVFFNEYPEFSKYRTYLQGRTMYDLVARIRTNPQRVLPIMFELSTHPKFFAAYSSNMYREFYRPDMDLMYSLHKGVFEDSIHSLNGIMKRNPDKTNYLGYITQTIDSVASIKYAQYFQDENGNTIMRTLKDSSMNVVKMMVENRINGMLSKMAPIRFDDMIEKYNASYDAATKQFSFTIPGADIAVAFNPQMKRGQAFEISRILGDGATTKLAFYNGKADWDNLLGFFNDFLKVDFSPMSNYMKNYLSLKSIGESVQYDAAISDLLQFSTSVFFNAYVSHELVYKEMGWERFNNTLQEIYGEENKPGIIKSSAEISLTSKAYIPVLSDLANANSMTTGSFSSSIVKDGDGNALAATTITRLFDSYHTQWVTQCKYNVNSATKALSLLDNPKLLKGVITSREYKTREQTKQHSSFNVAESYFSSLVYDYVGSLVEREDNSNRIGEAGFMPSVNSDKTTVLKMMVALNETSRLKKKYSELTRDEVRSLINSEIGTVYGRIIDNIVSDFTKLNEFASSLGNTVPINPMTNFAEFNEFYGKGAAQHLSFLVKAYNDSHNTNLIELIDQVHYINNKGFLSFNRSLVSLANRFNPNYFTSKGYKPAEVFGRLTTANEFWNLKERELLSNLLDNGFSIETTDERGRAYTTPEIQYFAKMSNWVYPNTKKVILAKFTPAGKSTINISEWSDFGSIGYKDIDQFGREVYRTYTSDEFDITKLKGTLELHPTIANQNALDYFFTQEYMLTTVGTHISHPAKKAASDPLDLVEEAARYVAQHKRNVSFTASMHTFQQGMLNGIPSTYRMAVIDDLPAVVYNIMGDYDDRGAKPYDGATFVNPFIVHLENNSLAGSKAGIDKKQFVHAYKEKTCTGIIVKTAGFGLTNDRMKNSSFYRLMMKKMTNHAWRDHLGNPYVTDITKDFRGNLIPYDTMYYKSADGKFYMINSIVSNGDNTYSIVKSQVEPDGTIIKELPLEITQPITTNYALWNMFGGMNSMSLKNGRLVPSEVSITNVVKAINGIGVVLNPNGEVNTQDDIYQVLKHSDIHYVPTAGAVKQGAANINTESSYTDEEDYNIMEIKMNNAGIQLDASHHADEANLSIMTQVISSLASRGFTAEQAQEVYDALSGLTEYGIRDYIDSYSEYLESGNPEQFQNVITKTIVKTLMNSSDKDGNIVQAVAQALLDKAAEGKELTFKDTKGIIPYSDPSVFNQLVSTITSSLNRSAIRVKFAGTLSVLNPSHGIWKLYGDRKLDSFNNKEEIENLQKLYDTKPLHSLSEIQLGRTYNVTVDGVTTARFVETPQQYWDLKKELLGKEAIVVENVVTGRDLGAYNIHFSDIQGNTYNMWDLDIVKAMYEFRSRVDRIKGAKEDADRVAALADMQSWLASYNLNSEIKTAYKQLQSSMQRVLGAIGSGDSNTVFVDGQQIVINKDSINISAYETIMPKIYMSKFGLDQYDDLSTIKNDPLFFMKRMLANWQSKVDDRDFDIELKRLNGNHTYLVNKSTFKSTTLAPKEIDKGWDGGKIYRKGPKGENMYRLSSENDMVYTDANGNEIIVTDDLGFYLESTSYHTIRVSDSAAQSSHFESIINPVLVSQGKVAKRFSKYVNHDDVAKNVLRMNQSYRASLDSIQKNPNKAVSDPSVQMIYESSQEIYSSFIKSLDVLAARIPSQTMQSFMPMKVVAFDNPDVNSAYVNYWQIWLQGSDFDIDKVSMLGYSFDKTGKYVGWSPYFNLSSIKTLKSSEKLPFPTGKKLELVPTNDTSLTNWGHDYVGSGKLFSFSGTEVLFLPEYDEDGSLGSLELLSDFLRMVRSNDGKLYIPANSTIPFDKMAEYIDRHNLYLSSRKGDAGMDMVRNFISTYMYNISIDPINLIQSQSPIDLGEPQAAAENSSAGKLVKTFTPGNTVNKHISLFENMAGKEVIGISAAGMKDFFALTQYYNYVLRSGDPVKQSYLLFNKTIGGQNVRLLANTYTNDLSKITDAQLLEALKTVDNTKDAALVLSALLSCATDNAKELVLSKINAGADMVGLYIYGIAIGIDFNRIADIMMSKTARVLSKIKNGNIFNNTKDMAFLTNVFDYIDDGPEVANLDPEFLAELGAALQIQESMSPSLIRSTLARTMRNSNGSDFLIESKLQFIKSLKRVANSLDSESARVSSFKFIDKLREYVSALQAIESDGGHRYQTIKELYYGSSELRKLGSILGLNQGLKTKVDSKLGFIRSFENLFNDRFGEFSKDETVRNVQMSQPALLNGEYTTIGNVFATLANYVKDDNTGLDGEVIESRKYKISFERFMNDDTYRNTIINLYNGVKHTFNILDVVWTLPHFRGYLKTAFIDYAAQRSQSSKFRAIDSIGGRVIDKYGFKSSKDIQSVYRGVQSFLDNILVNSWMRSANKIIEVQKGVTVYSNNGGEFVTEERTPIVLGTDWGNASFKSWMESTVIPDLKNGVLSEKSKIFMNNKFIKDLTPLRIDRTATKNATFIYTLPVSMIPKSDSEKASYMMYKSEFNKLQSLRYFGYPVSDLFFYYNLINFRNSTTQNSLTPMFEQILRDGSSPLLQEYNSYVSMFDTGSDLVEDVDYVIDDAVIWCAPKMDTNLARTPYVYAYDYATMTTKLYKRIPTRDSQEGEIPQDIDYAYDFGVEDFMDDGEFRSTKLEPNPDYQAIEDNRDSRYFLTKASALTPGNTLRLNASTLISIDNGKLSELKYERKTYTRGEVIAKLKELGGNESDLEIPYVTRRVGNVNEQVLDNTTLLEILDHIFKNPC